MIKRYVMDPRKLERHVIETKQWSYPYRYDKVAFAGRLCTGPLLLGCPRTVPARTGRVWEPSDLGRSSSGGTPAHRTQRLVDRREPTHSILSLQELFHVRRKEFWPLTQAEKLLHDFIPNQIPHEADGLIFQGGSCCIG